MIKILKNLNKKELSFILISIVLIVIQVILDLKIPDYMSSITKLVQTEGSTTKEILSNGLMMLLCSLGSLILAFLVGFFAAYIGTSFEKNIRKKVFYKVGNFGASEIKEFKTSSLITRCTNDITNVRTLLIMGIQVLAKAPIMTIIAISKIIDKDFKFTLLTIIGVVIVIILNLVVILIAIPRFKKIQKLTDNLNEITRENLTGIRVVRAYNAENYELKKFEKANKDLTSNHLFTGKLMSLIGPTMGGVLNFLSLGIYLVGASLINNAIGMNKLTIFSDMIVFSSYAVQVIISFMMLTLVFIIYPRASVSMKRIAEVLDKNPIIKYGEFKNNLKGLVEFKNVSFKYPDADEYILKDVTFKANPGETIAIIGSTGCGKSTLVNLIPRFYDATEGTILIDNIDIKELDESTLASLIGYVSQKAVLFKGTIKENVAFGKNKINEEKVEEALKIAECEFVNKLDKGINHNISQGGTNISGGQKQRIQVARAIYKNPSIYIFDDSFSALDYKTDFNIRKKLNKYTKNATKFIVASRIGTIKDANQIIVLDEGKIVGIGKHENLLKTCKVYKEIAVSQGFKEENI